MRRGEFGNTVVYVKRYRKLSLAFFAGAVVAGGVAFLLPDKELGYQMLPYGGMFFLVSLCFQHYSQSFTIDPDAGTILIEERRLLHVTKRRQLPMAGVRVRTSSAPMGSRRRYWIWLEYEGQPSILFLGNLGDQRQLQDLVVHLRQDLRCPGAFPLPPLT